MKITVTISETREEEGKRQKNSEIVLIIKRSVTVSVLPMLRLQVVPAGPAMRNSFPCLFPGPGRPAR